LNDEPQLPTQRTKRLLPAALFVLLVIGVYTDPLLFRRNFGGRDLIGYNLPIESAIHDAYSRGRLPVWVSGISGGRPLLANPNCGALYPVRALLGIFPFPVAMKLFPVIHWMLAGLGMLALLSVLRAPPAAAWIGAVTYVFSGVGISEVFYTNHHPGVMLVPWIVWALARRWERRGSQILVLALLFGLDFLGGDVFTIGIGIGAALLWATVEIERAGRVRAFKTLAAAIGLGLLIGFPQILATYLWAPETDRAIRGISLGEVVIFSIHPFRLLEFFIPYPFGTTWKIDPMELWGLTIFHGKGIGFFSSFYAGALAVIAFVATRKRRAKKGAAKQAETRKSGKAPGKSAGKTAPPAGDSRPRGVRFARILLLAALAIAVPPSMLPMSWYHTSSPLPLRYPEKFGVAIAFALAILTGLAFEGLRRPTQKLRWTLWVGGALALLALGAFLSPDGTKDTVMLLTGVDLPYAKRAVRVLPSALVEAGLLWMATVVALDLLRKGSRGGFAAGLAILTAVPILGVSKIAQTYDRDYLIGPTPLVFFTRRMDPEGQYRVLGEASYRPASALEEFQGTTDFGQFELFRRNWQYFMHELWRRGTVLNYDFDDGNLSRTESLRRISFVEGYSDSPAFFGSLSLRWGIRFRDQEPLAGYHPVYGNMIQIVDEIDKAYPDIRLVEKWREQWSATEALSLLGNLKDGEIVVESGKRGEGAARPGTVRVKERSPERLLLETEAPDPAWLFVLRGFTTYRTILLDGRKVECFPAQLAFSSIRVPAGRHTIEWRENVPGGRVSRWGPVLFLLAAAGLVLVPRLRKSA
jgi:hypothetical protein